MPKRSVGRLSREFLAHIVPAIMKPARTLWHEVFGFLFLSLAVIIGANAIRFYLGPDFDGGPGSFMRLVMSAFCVLLFGWYGITSFLRARSISRS